MRLSGLSTDEVIRFERWTKSEIARRQALPLTGARGLLVAVGIPFRAARLALATQPHQRLRIVGPVLVFDHPAEPFMRNLIRERPPEPQSSMPQLSRWARARGAVAAVLVGCLSLRSFYRYLGVGGETSKAHLVKGLVAFAHAHAALRQFACTAVVVTHDLVPRPYFTALASNRVGVPIWMTLLDHELRIKVPFRLSGLIGYQPHDACGMSPQPPVFVTLPVPPQRPRFRDGEALLGLVLLPHPAYLPLPEFAVTLGVLLLKGPRVARIRVRPHPAHHVDFASLPPGIELDDLSGLLEDSLADVDFAVSFGHSSATRTVQRAGIPIFTVDWRNLRREALVVRRQLCALEAVGALPGVVQEEGNCHAAGHPDVLDFATLRERLGI